MDSELECICYQTTIPDKYVIDRAYHTLKTHADFKGLFMWIQLDNSRRPAIYIDHSRNKEMDPKLKYFENVCPQTLLMYFIPQMQEKVKAMLKKHGKDLWLLPDDAPKMTLDIERSKSHMLFLDI